MMSAFDASNSVARPVRNERGATIVFIAVIITVLMSVVALAIDIGMLLDARTEAQRVADAGAMAGAGAYKELVASQAAAETAARAEAVAVGALNNIHGDPTIILPDEDVDVDHDERLVRVRVHRSTERGSAIPTWFARVFDINAVDVGAVAAARIAFGNTVQCLKPWAVMDGYLDNNANGVWDQGFDEYPLDGDGAPVYGYGTETGAVHRDGIDEDPLTYPKDRGRPIRLKPGNPSESYQPGWFYPFDIPLEDGPSVGGARYRENIVSCNPNTFALGEEQLTETGNMVGPTKQGVDELVSQAPGAQWLYDEETGGEVINCPSPCPRVGYVPLFEPTQEIANGKTEIVFSNVMSVFIEGMDGRDVIGRIIGPVPGGFDPSGGPGVPNIQFIQLVE